MVRCENLGPFGVPIVIRPPTVHPNTRHTFDNLPFGGFQVTVRGPGFRRLQGTYYVVRGPKPCPRNYAQNWRKLFEAVRGYTIWTVGCITPLTDSL